MNTVAASLGTSAAEFAFVSALAREMSAGEIELPGFPDIAIRIRRVMQDQDVAPVNRMQLDVEVYKHLLEESASEIAAVRSALGN